jgi:hypothetical protein
MSLVSGSATSAKRRSTHVRLPSRLVAGLSMLVACVGACSSDRAPGGHDMTAARSGTGGPGMSEAPLSGAGGSAASGGTGAAGRNAVGGAGGRGSSGASAMSGAGGPSGRGGMSGGSGSSAAGSGGAPASTDAGVDAQAGAACESASLQWRTARKTSYTSYPDPGSEECVKYNGCMWAGQFAACDGKKTEQWVASHNVVAVFPDFKSLKLHDLCLRARGKTIVVTVYDTCADSDCDGCCTENRGSADQLIDVESYTEQRWGVTDGMIEWADLGPTQSGGCN